MTDKRALEPFPWAAVMAFGFGHLRLSPQAFWSMSLPEIAAAMRAHASPLGLGHGVPMSRTDFDALQMTFPDEE